MSTVPSDSRWRSARKRENCGLKTTAGRKKKDLRLWCWGLFHLKTAEEGFEDDVTLVCVCQRWEKLGFSLLIPFLVSL